jgi:hypothetical protein
MVMGALVSSVTHSFSKVLQEQTSLHYYNLYQVFLFPGTLIIFCSRAAEPAKIIIIICGSRSNSLWLVLSSFVLKVELCLPNSLDQAVTVTFPSYWNLQTILILVPGFIN